MARLAAKATGSAAQAAGAATGTARDRRSGLRAYFVGKAAVAGVKAVKNKRAAGKDVEPAAKSETKEKDSTATAAAIAAGQKGKDAAKSAVSSATAAAAIERSPASRSPLVPPDLARPGRQAWNQEAGQQRTPSPLPLGPHAATEVEQHRRPPMSDETPSASTARANGSPILLPEPKKSSTRRTSESPASTNESSAVPRVSPSTARPQPSELVRPLPTLRRVGGNELQALDRDRSRSSNGRCHDRRHPDHDAAPQRIGRLDKLRRACQSRPLPAPKWHRPTPPFSPENKPRSSRTIIAVGEQMGFSDQGIIVALSTASQESGFKNYANDGTGILAA